MKLYLENLNLVDLISEKHAKLRTMVRNSWAEKGEEPVTDTESRILALLEREPLTVSQIAIKIDMSRQGIHKCAQGLISREYIRVEAIEGNSRDKILLITDKGIRFCNETLIIKEKFEDDIKKSIGEDNFKILKETLKETWFTR